MKSTLEWQNAWTAPRDGPVVMLAHRGEGGKYGWSHVGYWGLFPGGEGTHAYPWVCIIGKGEKIRWPQFAPTHWAPLPDYPGKLVKKPAKEIVETTDAKP